MSARDGGAVVAAQSAAARAAGALVAGATIGVLGSALIVGTPGPGLNVVLLPTAGLVALALLLRTDGARRMSREAAALMGVAWAFTLTWAVRDAESLHVLALLAALVVVSLAARHAMTPWVRRAGAGEYVEAGVVSWFNLALGPILLVREVVAGASTAGGVAPWRRGAAAAVRGVVLAVPLLVVFGALLIAADPVFAELVGSAFRLDLERLAEHVIVAGVIAWPTAGYLRGFLFGTRVPEGFVPAVRPRLGALEAGIPLALLDLLFLAFIAVQVRYLFGGAGLVEVTPGLTYAEYARRGFFELAAVAALTVPVLLVADWAVARETRRAAAVFHVLAGALIALVLAIMASALYRMRLYQQAYGLTELRIYTTALTIWTGVTLAWLAVALWRGRRRDFAFGALVAGLAVVGTLVVANPHALIVRVNAARAAAGHEFDVSYVIRLGADAVPPLLDALPELPAGPRCEVAAWLLHRWGAPLPDWRSWNLADHRARARVARDADALRAACAG